MPIDIFISFDMNSANSDQIETFASALATYDMIGEIRYWKTSMKESEIPHMNEFMQTCDLFIFFISRPFENSSILQKEMQIAELLQKKKIILYTDKQDLPDSMVKSDKLDANNLLAIIPYSVINFEIIIKTVYLTIIKMRTLEILTQNDKKSLDLQNPSETGKNDKDYEREMGRLESKLDSMVDVMEGLADSVKNMSKGIFSIQKSVKSLNEDEEA